MRATIDFFIVFCLALLLTGCSVRRTVSEVTLRDSIRIERLVPHVFEPQEASVEAWIQCDKRGRAMLSRIEELESDRISLTLALDSMEDSISRLRINVRTPPDTVWIKADSVYIRERVEIPVEVERDLTLTEKVRMRMWEASIVLLLIFIAYIVMKRLFF